MINVTSILIPLVVVSFMVVALFQFKEKKTVTIKSDQKRREDRVE